MILFILAHLIELVLIGYIGGVCVSDLIDAWSRSDHRKRP